MGNIIDYLKDKIYYIMGATVLLIIILIVISSCGSSGSGGTYSAIESNMVKAAKKYYSSRENKLPEEDGTAKVTIGTLVELELLKEVKDPKNKNKLCNGYVLTKKVGEEYVHTPFLTCKGNYEPEYLSDKIKGTDKDEYGNGIYEIDGEYVYRGEDVKNYVSFANKLWRIVKVDKDGDLKLVLATKTEDFYIFDDSYNSEVEKSYGIVTDYLRTDIRKTLVSYYDTQIDNESKAKIVSKDLCVGSYKVTDEFNKEQECSKLMEDEDIGLLLASDYQMASLATECKTLSDKECGNYNYMYNFVNSWILNSETDSSYRNFYLKNGISSTYAKYKKPINPVVFITKDSITTEGDGTEEKPYIIK